MKREYGIDLFEMAAMVMGDAHHIWMPEQT